MECTSARVDLDVAGSAMPCHVAVPTVSSATSQAVSSAISQAVSSAISQTAAGRSPAVVVVQEAFGLNGNIRRVADDLARLGYVALAPDLYHRLGSPVVPYDDVPRAIELLGRLADDEVRADVAAALGYLGGRADVSTERIGIVGFCMGGRVAFQAATWFPRAFRAVVSFYGGGIAADHPRAPVHAARALEAPVLALFGELDQLIPLEQVARLEAALRAAGKVCETVVYPGAGHGFFCDERASWHPDAAADARRRLEAWLGRHLG